MGTLCAMPANINISFSLQYIENLEECKSLTSLNFSGNIIQKIEHIEHLTRLRELNFANNQIRYIHKH